MSAIRATKFKTVSAATAQELDEKLRTAKTEIIQQNENAQILDFRLATSQGTVYATIVWSG